MSKQDSQQFINEFEKEVHLSDYLNVVLRRWKIVALVFLLVFSAITAYTFITKPVYEAASSIEVGGKKKSGLLAELDLGGEGSVETDIEKLRSRTLAEKVIRQLNLHWQLEDSSDGIDLEILEFSVEGDLAGLRLELTGPDSYRVADLAGRQLATGRSGEPCIFPAGRIKLDIRQGASGAYLELQRIPLDELLIAFANNLSVGEVGKMTNVVRVSYRSTDPVQARNVVNLLIDGYLNQNVTSRTLEAGKAVNFISQQLDGVKGKLDSSEQALQEYKVQTGIATIGPEGNSLIEKMASLEQQKTDLKLKQERIDYAVTTLREVLRTGEPFTPPTIEGVAQITDLANRLAELEAERKGLLVDYTPAHPMVVDIQSQIARVHETLLSTYLTVRQELVLGIRDIDSTLGGFEKQLNDIPAAELELAKRMRVNTVNAELYTFLLQKQQEARIAEASTISNAEVIDRAVTPLKPVSPNKKKNLALGLILGLMLGIGLAFLLDYMDQTIKTGDDVRDKLGLNVFGTIPHIPSKGEGAKQAPGHLISTQDPKSPVVEAFRALRTNLNYLTAKEKHKVILMTSALPNEGKSTVSANLAAVLSQTGSRVLLVGCDLRRPTLHELFGQPAVPGLVEMLIDDQQGALRQLASPRLDLIPSGSVPPNPAELLDSERFRRFITIVRQRYDYVIIDAPPVLPVTDAQILTPMVDINLVVLEPCRVPEKAAKQMVASLMAVDARISGVILNDKTGRGFKHYGTYGYYGNQKYKGYYGESTVDETGVLGKIWKAINS